MHYTLRILRPCPSLGLYPGDLATYEPTEEPSDQLYLHRPLAANLGPLVVLLESGAAELITPHSTVSDFAEAVGADHAVRPPGVSPRPASGRALHLEP